MKNHLATVLIKVALENQQIESNFLWFFADTRNEMEHESRWIDFFYYYLNLDFFSQWIELDINHHTYIRWLLVIVGVPIMNNEYSFYFHVSLSLLIIIQLRFHVKIVIQREKFQSSIHENATKMFADAFLLLINVCKCCWDCPKIPMHIIERDIFDVVIWGEEWEAFNMLLNFSLALRISPSPSWYRRSMIWYDVNKV